MSLRVLLTHVESLTNGSRHASRCCYMRPNCPKSERWLSLLTTFPSLPMDVNAESQALCKNVEQHKKTIKHVLALTPYDCSGKRHVLPISILTELKGLIKEKADEISKEILSAGVGPKLAGSCEDDNDSWSDFKAHDLFECTSTSKEKSKYHKKGSRNSQDFQSQDIRKQPNVYRGERRACSDEDHRVKKIQPNYFIAVQVTNPEILAIAKKVQSGIQEKSKVNLERAFINLEKFHITLMVMHLTNEEDIKKAVESLKRCVPAIQERTAGQPVKLDFEGLSTFGAGRVLFAPLKPSEGLDHLHFMAGEVSKQMAVTGIFSTDGDNQSRKFHPHLTIMKFKGDKALYRQGVTKVNLDQYQGFIDETFGAQSVCSIQLCDMKRRREDGYYFVEHEVFFCK